MLIKEYFFWKLMARNRPGWVRRLDSCRRLHLRDGKADATLSLRKRYAEHAIRVIGDPGLEDEHCGDCDGRWRYSVAMNHTLSAKLG
jgi:hypothetical protein